MSARCLQGVCKVSGTCLEGVCKVSKRCNEGVFIVSVRYSEAVHRHLEGVWNMLVRCMEQVSCTLKLSVRCLGFIVFFCGTAGRTRFP